MKILLAIDATKPKLLQDTSLRWAGRCGFEIRVFVAKGKRRRFVDAVDDANYHYYMALDKEGTVISRMSAKDYAEIFEYDLVVHIPEDLKEWRKGTQFRLKEIKYPYEAIASARGEFSRKPRMKVKRWKNGAWMERVK